MAGGDRNFPHRVHGIDFGTIHNTYRACTQYVHSVSIVSIQCASNDDYSSCRYGRELGTITRRVSRQNDKTIVISGVPIHHIERLCAHRRSQRRQPIQIINV